LYPGTRGRRRIPIVKESHVKQMILIETILLEASWQQRILDGVEAKIRWWKNIGKVMLNKIDS